MAQEQEQPQRKQAKNYDALKRKFIVWLATPEEERYPVTQGLFAQENGINQGTLSDWKARPEFMAKVNELVDKHLADDYNEAVASLKRMVKRGSFNHLKLYFEMIGKYVPKIAPTTPDGKNPYDSTPTDELFRELDQILAKGRANKGAGDTQ